MQLDFEIGKSSDPRGHALIYFRDSGDREMVSATYIVILPIPIDIAKYMPPFLAGQVSDMGSESIGSFAFPPAPEQVAAYDDIRKAAEARNDDLIYGGAVSLSDVFETMERVSEATAEYDRLYNEAYQRLGSGGQQQQIEMSDEDELEESIHDLMYGNMAEADLLSELTAQLGRMRYAVEGQDASTASETRAKLRAIGRHLPANREVTKLIAAASRNNPVASELSQLYLERAYCLYREDYLRLKKIDADIEALQSQE